MSWSIFAKGTHSEVRQQIDQQKYCAQADPEQERQFERCKQLILAEMASWPARPQWDGVKVVAGGHRDTSEAGNFTVSVLPYSIAEETKRIADLQPVNTPTETVTSDGGKSEPKAEAGTGSRKKKAAPITGQNPEDQPLLK